LRIIGIGSGEAAHRKFTIAGREGAAVEVYRKATRYITLSCSQIGDCAELTNIDDLVDFIVAHYGKTNGHTIRAAAGCEFESDWHRAPHQAVKVLV
jgi:hypothetical protein